MARLKIRWSNNEEVYREEDGVVLLDKREFDANHAYHIMGDIESFVSPIDRTIIHGRSTLREHNKRHDVTNASDFTETWAKAEKKREKIRSGEFESKSMRESIIREYERRS